MTLADFFQSVNLAGIRLANVSGQLQLRPASAVTDAIRNAAIAHKPELLAILPEIVPLADAELVAEHSAIQWEPTLSPASAAVLLTAWDQQEPILWDAGKAEALATEASAMHHAAGWPADAEGRRRRGEILDAIDDAIMRKDMARLQTATGLFLAAVLAPANAEDAQAVLRWLDDSALLPSCPGCTSCRPVTTCRKDKYRRRTGSRPEMGPPAHATPRDDYGKQSFSCVLAETESIGYHHQYEQEPNETK